MKYLRASFAKVHTQPVRVAAVVLHKVCYCCKRGSACYEKPAIIELPYSVMFYCVTISYYNHTTWLYHSIHKTIDC